MSSSFQRFMDRLLGKNVIQGETAADHAEEPYAANPSDDQSEHIEYLHEWVRREVAAGYTTRDEIEDNAVDYLIDDLDEEQVRKIAPAIITKALEEHRRAEATWPAITDYDRLDSAFTALEQAGIVSRQNFSCCGTCASGEIWDEMEEAGKAGLKVRGYSYFHMQDTEGAVDGGGLYLGYGATEEGEAAALAIAKEIVDTLERSGLKTDWDGRWEKRIGVMLDWKRRRGD